MQEQNFHDYATSLNEAIRQLAVFICKTGYSDVRWRNIPVLNNSLDENGNRKIALIDIEEMDSPEVGLFGGARTRGLVRCVNEEQGKIVEEVAKRNWIKTRYFANAREWRRKEIEDENKLKEYYATKNITRGNEIIDVNENSVNSPEYPEHIKEIRKATKDLVQVINDQISKSSPEQSIKRRRSIYIDPFEERLEWLSRLIHRRPTELYETEEDYYDATYLGYVVKKLIELGHIHKIVKIYGNSRYLLQA